MIIPVDCPLCKQNIALASQGVRRGEIIVCPRCSGRIPVTGRFLSEIFWVFNARMRIQSL